MKIIFYIIKLIKNKKLKIIKFVQFKKKRDRLLDRLDEIEWVGRVVGNRRWIGFVGQKLIC